MSSKNVVILSDANFQKEVLQSELPVLVDFTATWCGPCQKIAPLIDAVADETVGKFKVAKLDIDEAGETASKLGIRGVPTMIAFKAGRESARHSGANIGKQGLIELLNK
jgi:thioredoxin 1